MREAHENPHVDQQAPEEEGFRAANEAARLRYRRATFSPIRQLYVRWVRSRVQDPLKQQRLKTLYLARGYIPLLRQSAFKWRERLALILRFLRVDWHVLHGHLPSEISAIAHELAKRPARPGELMIEAGCWKGGSSAKFSILCDQLGYRLHVYDSFRGVERLSPQAAAQEWRGFQGQYEAPEEELRANLANYGAATVCSVHRGWFSDTLARQPLEAPVRLVYIDCDLAKGTLEVLAGVAKALVPDGVVFTQDYHIEPVRRALFDRGTWESLGVDMPEIQPLGVHLARLSWPSSVGPGSGEEDLPGNE